MNKKGDITGWGKRRDLRPPKYRFGDSEVWNGVTDLTTRLI